MRDLIDPEDGENRAVRAFLMHYGSPGLSVGRMRENLRMSGFNGCWPEWVKDEPENMHLTKSGAQDWLRYLFALEGKDGVGEVPEANPSDDHFRERIDTYADKHPSLVVRQLATLLRDAWRAAGVEGRKP
jgi:hypothetical protein